MATPEKAAATVAGEYENQSKLYEAYNELHGLAQEFETPFDAPAVLVVGHQTDGKSALVEALMGFQFNHVGGGTKTRRPVTLHMKFNPECHEPVCHLVCDNDSCVVQQKSLKEVQIDPELSRTVVVSTKLDAKIPQFARASDVEVFLSPPVSVLDGFMLGDSPFFTSVPSGRVGSGHESVYRSNDEFKQAISLREMEDVASLEEKLGRSLSKQERSRIGVSSLKLFLEELLMKRYMDSVPLIIPLLEKEYRGTTRKLNDINQELSALDEVKLKEKARAFHDLFLTKLSLLLKGSVVAPPDKFGETLQDERVNGGALIGIDGSQFPLKLIPNAGMRLYGGAQYHRAMAEFRFVVGGIKCPPITREEIVNACGVEDIHDGTNYSRCMEDLISTTRYVTWSLHNKNRAGLRQFLDSFGGAEQPGNGGTDSSTSVQTTETRLADLLDSTLWNRRLAPSSERIVYALVQQIFHGIREYFLASAELKFNCFFLMPVVDKLPALLREDLESAFEDDLDNVFDITNLRHSLGQRKRETEIEMKRIQRLKDKFRKIHEQLSLHQVMP